jgi:hypothetical protein
MEVNAETTKKSKRKVAKREGELEAIKRKLKRSVDSKNPVYDELVTLIEKLDEKLDKLEKHLGKLEMAILEDMEQHIKADELRLLGERVRLPNEPLGFERTNVPALFEE